jgi:hypothetical protein
VKTDFNGDGQEYPSHIVHPTKRVSSGGVQRVRSAFVRRPTELSTFEIQARGGNRGWSPPEPSLLCRYKGRKKLMTRQQNMRAIIE